MRYEMQLTPEGLCEGCGGCGDPDCCVHDSECRVWSADSVEELAEHYRVEHSETVNYAAHACDRWARGFDYCENCHYEEEVEDV